MDLQKGKFLPANKERDNQFNDGNIEEGTENAPLIIKE